MIVMISGTIQTLSPSGARKLIAVTVLTCIIASALVLCLPASDAAEEQEYDTDLGQFWSYTVQFQFAGADALSVTYDFGDGSEPVVGDAENPDGWNPRHVFPGKGVYYVTQTVYNTSQGGSYASEVFKVEIMGYPEIHFEENGGSEVQDIEQTAYNVVAAQPEDPIRDGYTFTGWFTDEDCTQAFDWTQGLKKDITLYAGWESNGQTPVDPEPTPEEPEDDDGFQIELWMIILIIVVIIVIVAILIWRH